MMDGTGHFPTTLQRARGKADVAFRQGDLARLYQSGAAKALLPRSYGTAHEIVLVNTAGGITGGDHFAYDCSSDASRVIVTTQAAERAYRSSTTDIASMKIRLRARDGASLHWLPQETILFDGSRLDRQIDVDLDADSECLILESLVFGRHAMGELLRTCHFTDRWRIRQNGQLLHAEALSLADDSNTLLGMAAGGAGAQMAATLVYAGPRLEQVHADINAVLPTTGSRMAISHWNGRCVLRMLASSTMTGKSDLSRILNSIHGQQIPRVWQS